MEIGILQKKHQKALKKIRQLKQSLAAVRADYQSASKERGNLRFERERYRAACVEFHTTALECMDEHKVISNKWAVQKTTRLFAVSESFIMP